MYLCMYICVDCPLSLKNSSPKNEFGPVLSTFFWWDCLVIEFGW